MTEEINRTLINLIPAETAVLGYLSDFKNLTISYGEAFSILLANNTYENDKDRLEQIKKELCVLEALLRHFNELNPGVTNGKKSEAVQTANEKKFADAKYYLLLFTGIMASGCEGYDGIANLLLICATPLPAIIATGMVFSVIQMLIFHGIEANAFAKAFGVNGTDALKLVSSYAKEMELIEKISTKITANLITEEELVKLQQYLLTIQTLKKKMADFDKISQQIAAKNNDPAVVAAKLAMTSMAAMIIFASYYFSAQFVAGTIAALFITGVSATFWPIMVFSAIVALCAVINFCFIQRPAIETMIAEKFGLDKKSLKTLTNDEQRTTLNQKLETLENDIGIKIKNNTTRQEKETAAQEIIKELRLENCSLKIGDKWGKFKGNFAGTDKERFVERAEHFVKYRHCFSFFPHPKNDDTTELASSPSVALT